MMRFEYGDRPPRACNGLWPGSLSIDELILCSDENGSKILRVSDISLPIFGTTQVRVGHSVATLEDATKDVPLPWVRRARQLYANRRNCKGLIFVRLEPTPDVPCTKSEIAAGVKVDDEARDTICMISRNRLDGDSVRIPGAGELIPFRDLKGAKVREILKVARVIHLVGYGHNPPKYRRLATVVLLTSEGTDEAKARLESKSASKAEAIDKEASEGQEAQAAYEANAAKIKEAEAKAADLAANAEPHNPPQKKADQPAPKEQKPAEKKNTGKTQAPKG